MEWIQKLWSLSKFAIKTAMTELGSTNFKWAKAMVFAIIKIEIPLMAIIDKNVKGDFQVENENEAMQIIPIFLLLHLYKDWVMLNSRKIKIMKTVWKLSSPIISRELRKLWENGFHVWLFVKFALVRIRTA